MKSYPTTWLYNAMKKFTDTREAARLEYVQRMKALEDAKGSKYYIDEKNKAASRRENIVEQARLECRQSLAGTFKTMRENNSKRPMQPPTDEQLRILELLKMRDNVTAGELQQAANAMNGNGAALQLLYEFARKMEIHNMADIRQDANEFSIAQAEDEINRIAGECRRILETGARRGAYLGAQYNARQHGIPVDEDSLPQIEPFTTEHEFETRMGYGDRLREATASL